MKMNVRQLSLFGIAITALCGTAFAADIEPYQSKPVEPYRAKAIEPYKAKTIEPYKAKTIESYQATTVQPWQAPATAPARGKTVTPYRAQGVPPNNTPSSGNIEIYQAPQTRRFTQADFDRMNAETAAQAKRIAAQRGGNAGPTTSASQQYWQQQIQHRQVEAANPNVTYGGR